MTGRSPVLQCPTGSCATFKLVRATTSVVLLPIIYSIVAT